ncbi:Rieske 2Fe-2S domain-containing protein [Pseudolabrys sp.]|uniref:aromatic ring-hydroxylating dioxygenase subunit alpha n=1 Tax=Pseudolabrys sp. TaxID=1960880 RepID=UPI003D104F28
MLSVQQNDKITRVAPGTPTGKLMRCYWQPVALSEELDPSRPIKAVRLLGQDFVLFRDENSRLGLLDRDCPHRGTDLSFGRLENGGLRCVFHGWLFDTKGRCLETPAEPKGSRLCQNIRQRSYPVAERNGIIFGYLGEGDPPAFADLDCFVAPDTHTFAFKGYIDCNWLQALEVGIDPAHASFLHRFEEDEDPSHSYGKQFRSTSADSDIPMTKIMREYPCPSIDVKLTEFGLRLLALREIDDNRTHVRVTNLVFPHAFVIPLSGEMTITQWHVPTDDESCYWYAIFTSFSAPVNKQEMREQRLKLYTLPDYKPRLNRGNDYGYSAEEQKSQTYTGMGSDINVHDQWAIESQGRIQDRTREHLGQSDKAIIAYRKLLVQSIDQAQAGEKPIMRLDEVEARQITGPATVDGIGPTDGWEAYWKQVEAKRRSGAAWLRKSA